MVQAGKTNFSYKNASTGAKHAIHAGMIMRSTP
jgi:hypothetical protein